MAFDRTLPEISKNELQFIIQKGEGMGVDERVVECLGGWPVQVTATNCHTVTVNVRLIVDPRPANSHRRLAEAIDRWRAKGEPIPSGLI